MDWLTTLAFAVLLLSIQYDASQSASTTLSKSPWTDPDKASSFMDCLITKIVESKTFPQQEKEDLKSIMDTLMSAVSGSNAKGKSSGPQLQAINMAIASSLAEIVVADDAENPTIIAEKTQDLAGGLTQCFESVMGTIDKKFISEINDLILMFAKKEAASEIKEPQDQADTSSSSSIQTTNQSTAQTTSIDVGDQVPKAAATEIEPQVSEAEPIGVEPQISKTPPESISGLTNELPNTSTPGAVLRSGVPQQTVRIAVYPNRSYSSSFPTTSQSNDNNYQSSQTFQGSSQTTGGYGRTYRGPQVSELIPINAGAQVSQPAPIGVGPQVLQPAPGRILRLGNEMTDESTRRAYQSSQTFQGSSQTTGGYGETYSGPQFSEPTPIDVEHQVSQAASGLISREENDLEDTSTRIAVSRSGVPQQTIPQGVYPNRLSSSSLKTTSQSIDNNYQSSQTFQGSSKRAGGYRGAYSGPQLTQPTLNGVEDQFSQSAPRRTWRVGNEMADTSTQRSILRSGVPQQTVRTAVYSNRLSSPSFQTTSQSTDNTYQSSQMSQGSSQMAGGYRGAYSGPRVSQTTPIGVGDQVSQPSPIDLGPQVSQPSPIDLGPQVSQSAPGRTWRVGNKMADTSTQRSILRSGVPQQTIPTAIYSNRSPSSSFQTRQFAANNYQSSQTSQGSSQMAGGYKGAYSGSQVSQPSPGRIWRVGNGMEDTSTRRAVLRSGVPQQTIPQGVYPNRLSSSLFQSTGQSSDNTYQSRQTLQGSSQAANRYGGTYLGPKYSKPTPIGVRPQISQSPPIGVRPRVSQAASGLNTRVSNELADTSKRITVLRSGARQQTVPIAMYPNRSSFQTASNSADKTYQSSKTFQGLSQTASGYGRAYSGTQVSQPVRIGVRPEISQPGIGPEISKAAPILSSSPASQGTSNERSCNDPLPEISVLPTLNSPNGLRSGSAGVRISQMTSAILNAISPSGVDANALARSLQASVSNLRSSGMSSSDAKLEVLLELIVGLLQIVSNAQIREINTTTATSVTSAAARCFEIALA